MKGHSWNFGKAIRSVFTDSVTFHIAVYFNSSLNKGKHTSKHYLRIKINAYENTNDSDKHSIHVHTYETENSIF